MQIPLALLETFLSTLSPVRGPPFEVFEQHQKRFVEDGSVLFPLFRKFLVVVAALLEVLFREGLDCGDGLLVVHGLRQFQGRLVEGFHERFLDDWVEVFDGLYDSGAGDVARWCC